MDNIIAEFKSMKQYVDDNLSRYITLEVPLLNELTESINYTLFSGGKRIRPIFCFLVGEIFDINKEKLRSVACSLEMIHTASLIMDDLPHMDDAATRRGKPANHIIYGQDVASLASIALLTRAFEAVLSDDTLDYQKRVLIVNKLANVVGLDGMVGGQFVDLKFGRDECDSSAIDFIHNNKTASLFIASGTVAAIIGEANETQLEALATYANCLGFAFQVLDDFLDAEGDESMAGKTLHSDKRNYVTLYGIEKSRKIIQQYTKNALDAIAPFGNKNTKLVLLCQILLQRNS